VSGPSTKPVAHPAVFSDRVLDAVVECLDELHYHAERYPLRVLDPFAGIGKVHSLPRILSLGVELEPEWANQHRQTIVGDSRFLPFPSGFFDGVITSPAYGNRMADHHDAKDDSRRITYRHTLGRELTDGNSGKMQWGLNYRTLHRRVWAECRRVTTDDGFFILNISDHVRAGVVVPVSEWHWKTLMTLGFKLVKEINVETPRMRFGQNHDARVTHEHVWLFVKS